MFCTGAAVATSCNININTSVRGQIFPQVAVVIVGEDFVCLFVVFFRYYYKQFVILSVSGRLTYQFGPNARGWRQKSRTEAA